MKTVLRRRSCCVRSGCRESFSMPKKAPSLPPQMPPMHERYNGKHWQLRDIVSIFVDVINNDTYFSVCLTRIPTPGEFITYGAIEYRVLRVSHCPVDDDGRTTVGYHLSSTPSGCQRIHLSLADVRRNAPQITELTSPADHLLVTSVEPGLGVSG